MANNIGEYSIILTASYQGLITAVDAAMKALTEKTQIATNAVTKMSEQTDKSMQKVSESMAKVSSQQFKAPTFQVQTDMLQKQQQNIDRLLNQYDNLSKRAQSYANANAKIGAVAFERMKIESDAISQKLSVSGVSLATRNPLSGMNFVQYASGFSQGGAAVEAARKSSSLVASEMGKMQQHLAWMGAATSVAGLLAVPVVIGRIEQQMAGMKQVLPGLQSDQQKMNQTTQEFIAIAGQYGLKVDEITESAKLWGRAYKDVATVEALLHSSSVLAVADSFSMTEANKALESTMMQYGLRARNAAEAQQFAMRIVDSWTNVAHSAIVSAQDLAAANERSASAAHLAGVSFDFLQGMIATMSRNTGRGGAEVGNAIKSMLTSIHTDKAVAEIEKLGVAMYETADDGTRRFRNTEQVLMDLMVASDATDKNIEKLMLSISGGKFQYNKIASLVGDFNELIRVTELSINSQGVAQHQAEMQIDTLVRKVQRLKDSLEGLVVNAGASGLTAWLKNFTDGLTTLVQRLQTMPEGNWGLLGYAIELSMALKAGMVVLNAARGAYAGYGGAVAAATAAKAAHVAVTGTEAAATGAAVLAKQAETAVTVQLTLAERALAVARGLSTGGLSLLIGGIITAAASYGILNTVSAETVKLQQEQKTAEERLAAQLRDKETATQSELDMNRSKVRFLENLAGIYPKLLDQLRQETSAGQDSAKVKEKIATTEQALTSMLGAEALERIKNSDNIKAALESEIGKLKEKQASLSEALRLERQAIIDHSALTIKKADERIDAIKAETLGLATEAQKQIAIYESINAAKLASLAGRADNDQRNVEDSTARLHEMLTRSGGKETDATIIERALQTDLVNQAGRSSAAYKAALSREGADILAAKKQAVEAIKAAGNPAAESSAKERGMVDDSGRGGKGQTAFEQATQRYEAEAAKREAEAALAGYAYTTQQKLDLYKQFMAGVERIDNAHHQETARYNKAIYSMTYQSQKEAVDMRKALLEKNIAEEKVTKRDVFEKEIAELQAIVNEELIGSTKRVNASTAVLKKKKEYGDYLVEVAKKERDLNKQIASDQAAMNMKAIDHAYSLGLINTPQKITAGLGEAKRKYSSVDSENRNVMGEGAVNPELQIELYDRYISAVDEAERKKLLVQMQSNAKWGVDVAQTLKKAMADYGAYSLEVAGLQEKMFDYQHRYQIAGAQGLISGVTSAMDGLMERTSTILQALRNMFKATLKSIANTFITDMAGKWSQTLSRMLMGTRSFAAQETQIRQAGAQASALAAIAAQTAEQAGEAAKCAVKVAVNRATENICRKESQLTKVSVLSDIGSMMTQMLAASAAMFVISALFGGGGSSETKSTAFVSLGRNPASYYSVPASVYVPSFDVGTTYVPEDMLANIHKGEMIIPAGFADGVRNMISNNFSAGNSEGSSIRVHQNVNASAIDGRGIKQVLDGSSQDVAKAVIKELRRRGVKLG